jgi:hypothetical protein
MTALVTATAAKVNMDSAMVILQLFDNSVYMVGGAGGEKKLRGRDFTGAYHFDGSLTVADKAGVKELVSQITPLLQELGDCRKIFLTPLACYWVLPCCSDLLHTTNYHSSGYLPKLGGAVFTLRDHIRDSFSRGKSPISCPLPKPHDCYGAVQA